VRSGFSELPMSESIETPKSYFVLGASGGIGSALVAKLHEAGARVALAGRNRETLEPLAARYDAPLHVLDARDAKAVEDAKKNLVRIPLHKGTLPHEQKGKFGGARVYIQPASHGTGVIAGGAVRAVLEAVGVHDVLSKSQGSSNPHNVVKATFDALLQLRSAETVAKQRGISLDKVFNG